MAKGNVGPVIWLGDIEATSAETGCSIPDTGRQRAPTVERMAADDQPDGLAAAAGAGGIFLARTTRRDPASHGLGGLHLYQFRLHAARYGSFKLSASSPDVLIETSSF
jgi:hypothetical protein